MKAAPSRGFKCCKCLVFFYLILNCVFGLAIGIFSSYLLLFRREKYIPKAKEIIVYFLIIPSLFAVFSTIVGWSSIRRKNIRLIKVFAVLLAVTVVLEIAGCLWCFSSLPKINDQVLLKIEQKFKEVSTDTLSENWFYNIQSKLQCCGLHGPTDYHTKQAVPFSCCGTNPQDITSGSCSFMWQKGCSNALTSEVSKDLILLSLIVLGIAFLQIPGVFISWCFANKISRDRI